MPETPQKDRPSIAVRAVTAWEGANGTVFDPATLTVRKGPERRLDALPSKAPVWFDMDLEGISATEWLEPWNPPAARAVNWSDLGGLAGLLGFNLPCRATPHDAVADALERLPTINEMGVLRWLGQRLDGKGYVAAPLLGCIPTCEIEGVEHDTEDTGPLELVLLRVNLIVIDRFMFTVRLPDRLCTGGKHLAHGRRIDAHVRVPHDTRPDLTVFSHHLPRAGTPTARELGDALTLYLSATCWSAAEHGRTRLIQTERAAKPDDAAPADCDRTLFEHVESAFQLGGSLQVFEEELLRVQQRLSEAPEAATCLPTAIRQRYSDAVGELRAVERDIRTAVDSLNTRLGQVQREQSRIREQKQSEAARLREQRQTRVERLLVGLGTFVVIPSLVVALFTDKAKFAAARWTMVVAMLGSVLIGLAVVALAPRMRVPQRLPRIRAAVAGGTALIALIVAAAALRT